MQECRSHYFELISAVRQGDKTVATKIKITLTAIKRQSVTITLIIIITNHYGNITTSATDNINY